MSNSSVQITEQALSIAGSIAMCTAPPWGPLAGGGALTLGAVLHDVYPDSNAPTLQQIATAISQQFAQHDIKVALDQIKAVQASLLAKTTGAGEHMPLPKGRIDKALRTESFGAFHDLYEVLRREISDAGDLVKAIGGMTTATQGDINRIDGNPQAACLPTFAFGVTTYLLLATCWTTLMARTDPAAIKASSLYAAVNYLTTVPAADHQGWLDYHASGVASFEAAVAARLDMVDSQATPYTLGWFGAGHGVHFRDKGSSSSIDNFDNNFTLTLFPGIVGTPHLPTPIPYGGDVTVPDGVEDVAFAILTEKSSQQAVVNGCNLLINDYKDRIRDTLYGNYFDPAKQREMADLWPKSLEKLKFALA